MIGLIFIVLEICFIRLMVHLWVTNEFFWFGVISICFIAMAYFYQKKQKHFPHNEIIQKKNVEIMPYRKCYWQAKNTTIVSKSQFKMLGWLAIFLLLMLYLFMKMPNFKTTDIFPVIGVCGLITLLFWSLFYGFASNEKAKNYDLEYRTYLVKNFVELINPSWKYQKADEQQTKKIRKQMLDTFEKGLDKPTSLLALGELNDSIHSFEVLDIMEMGICQCYFVFYTYVIQRLSPSYRLQNMFVCRNSSLETFSKDCKSSSIF